MTKNKWSNFVNWFVIRPKTSGFLIFLVLSVAIILISVQRYYILREEQETEMNFVLKDIHQKIEQSLKNCYVTTTALALTINDEGVPKNFEVVSKQLLESNHIVSIVQLVPNGVIKYIYPLKGNEAALGLDILSSKSLKDEAWKAVKTKKIYFAGPLNLKQGGFGIVGRLPVYNNDNKFWGFSAVVIKFSSLLKASGTETIDKSKYSFQFSKINPETKTEEFLITNKFDTTKNNFVSYQMPDSDWKIYLISKKSYFNNALILLPGILGLILAILFGILTTKLIEKPKELQLLVNNQSSTILKNEMKFKAIFDQATVGFAIIGADSGNFIEVNSKLCSMLGYTQEEFIDKNFSLFTHPDDISKSIQNLKNLREGKVREYSAEKRYIAKSGKVIWVNITVSPLWKTNEAPSTNIVFIKDITLRKKAQFLIEKSETRFRTLFDSSPLPLWEQDLSGVKKHLFDLNLMHKDPEIVYDFFDKNPDEINRCVSLTKIIDVNYECLNLLKVQDKTTFFENLAQLIGNDTVESIKQQLVAISQDAKQFSIDTRIRIANGEYRDINLRWNVIQGYEDTLKRVILSTQDITDRKASEKTILDSQTRTKSLINAIDGIVWEYDIYTQNFTFISQKVQDILGYKAKEWLKTPYFWENHIHPDDKDWVIEFCNPSRMDNSNRDFEYRMISKTGKIVWIRDIVNFVFENNVPVSLRGIMIDITKNKESENDLNSSFQLVTEQNKRLLNFSYIVSHNLRSHTSNIESITGLMDSSESEEEREQMMQLLKSVSNSLSETMDHLNEVININTNIDLVTKPLNLNQYILNTETLLCEQIQLHEVTIVSDIPEDLDINYNPAYLESILYNLISNAIRYRHPQRKPIIAIKWYKEKETNIIEIEDNGIGIDLKRNGDKIFGMYKTFTVNPDSRGIGLFITRNQIEAMGGHITVESEPNKGTTFKIYMK